MEILKSIDDLCKPDGRNMLFHKYDYSINQYRPFTLSDIHEIAAKYTLHDGVPDEIRNTFAIAQNMYAFSWYYYPFNAEAGFLALRATERALKIRLDMKKKKHGLKSLVLEAIDRNLLSEEEFTIPDRYKEVEKPLGEVAEERADSQQQSYLEMLPDMLSGMRNSPAHGESFIHPQGAVILRLAAETINQLFEKPERTDNLDEISNEE